MSEDLRIHKKYVVYRLNSVMGRDDYKALEEVTFKGWQHNSFDTEEEAIQQLIEDEMMYVNYVILTQIYINK